MSRGQQIHSSKLCPTGTAPVYGCSISRAAQLLIQPLQRVKGCGCTGVPATTHSPGLNMLFFSRVVDVCCRKILNKYLAGISWVSWSSPPNTVTQPTNKVSAASLSFVIFFLQCPMNAFETHPQRNRDTQFPLRHLWRIIHPFFPSPLVWFKLWLSCS